MVHLAEGDFMGMFNGFYGKLDGHVMKIWWDMMIYDMRMSSQSNNYLRRIGGFLLEMFIEMMGTSTPHDDMIYDMI